MQNNWNCHTLLVEMQNGTATLEHGLAYFMNVHVQTVVHPCSWKLLSNSNKLLIHATTLMNFKNITLSESTQTQKATYILHDSIHITFWKRQKTIGKRPDRPSLGAECGGRTTAREHREYFKSDRNILSWLWRWLHSCMSLSKLPELCNLGLHQKKMIFIICKSTWIKKKLNLKKGSRREVHPMAGNQGTCCGVEKSMLTSECLYLWQELRATQIVPLLDDCYEMYLF